MADLREKLVELLRSIPRSEEVNIGRRSGKSFIRLAIIADHLIANGVTIQRWIPVTERSPEKNDDGSVNTVLVTNGYIQHMAYFEHGIWRFTENGEMKEPMFYDITHWMPLPEPPKEE